MGEKSFPDRSTAGRVLARELMAYAGRDDVLVLALPRGGVPVGFEIAHALHAPLDIFLVRKLGAPQYEELAMGAIASGGTQILNEQVVEDLAITPEQIKETAERERRELERRERAFRDGVPGPSVTGQICILVDDGLATGSTMRAAVASLRKQNPMRVVMAVPVAARESFDELAALVDEAVCLYAPEPFVAVGRWYDDFTQLTDDEVRDYLKRSAYEMAH